MQLMPLIIQVGSLITSFVITQPLKLLVVHVISRHISDHFPHLIINKTNTDCKRCSFSKNDFSKFDKEKFVDGFAEKKFGLSLLIESCLDPKFDLFYQNLSSHVEHHAPSNKASKRDLNLTT